MPSKYVMNAGRFFLAGDATLAIRMPLPADETSTLGSLPREVIQHLGLHLPVQPLERSGEFAGTGEAAVGTAVDEAVAAIITHSIGRSRSPSHPPLAAP